MPEQTVVWVVQFWVKGYDYWGNCAEPTEGMFTLPVVSYETEDEGWARLDTLRAMNPNGKYRLVRVTTTIEDVS